MRTFRQAFPLWMHLLFLGLWLLIMAFAGYNPLTSGSWGVAAAVTLGVYGIFYVVADYRLVVCERGIIIGHFLSRRFCEVMAYPEISPRTVRQWTNCGRALSKTVFGPWHPIWYALLGSRKGITFVGPLMDRRGLKRDDVVLVPADKHGASMFAYRRPEKILHLIAHQIRVYDRSGGEAAAAWYDWAAATALTLTGAEDELFAQIPRKP